jgi:ParB/RepB/Spo0J family partition protein
MTAALPPLPGATLPVAAIVPSPSNPRKRFDETYLAELAESIKAHGLIQPITVRPLSLDALFAFNKRAHPDDERPVYEIVVGECRWRAAKLAGLTEIPGFWRELDDKQVLEIQVIENLQRRDVHPIEEAEGYQQLMQRHGYSADEIAAKIGKSRGYVYGRLKLTALCQEGRDAFFSGQLDASTALLVARIPGTALQKRAVKEVTNSYDGQPLTYRNAKNHIQYHFTISLKQATFPLDDAALVPTAGSCADCPKRSGNAPEICTDLKDEDVCTDTACFEDKKLTRRQQLIANAEKKGIAVFTGDSGWEAYRDEQRVDIDDTADGDPENRTYREILGDQLPRIDALAEVGHGTMQRMAELVDATTMKKALAKAGWQPDLLKTAEDQEPDRRQREAEAAERKAQQQAREADRAWRHRVAATLLDRVAERGDEKRINVSQTFAIIACAWIREQSAYAEIPEDLLENHGIKLPDEYDVDNELVEICATIRCWRLGKVLAFLFDALTHIDRHQSEGTPDTLLDLAELLDFDPETLREPVSTPPTAAQAPEDAAPATPAENKAKKPKVKTDPAPAVPANEPAAPVNPFGDWPFPTPKAEAA